jgi:hypothetical protein
MRSVEAFKVNVAPVAVTSLPKSFTAINSSAEDAPPRDL